MVQPRVLLNGAAEAGDAVPISPYLQSQLKLTTCATICTVTLNICAICSLVPQCCTFPLYATTMYSVRSMLCQRVKSSLVAENVLAAESVHYSAADHWPYQPAAPPLLGGDQLRFDARAGLDTSCQPKPRVDLDKNHLWNRPSLLRAKIKTELD